MRRYLQLGRGDFIQYLMELSEYAHQIFTSTVCSKIEPIERNVSCFPIQAGAVPRCVGTVHAHADWPAGERGARDECAGGGAGGAAPAGGAASRGLAGRHRLGSLLAQLPPRRAARHALRAQHDALPAGLLVPLALEAH